MKTLKIALLTVVAITTIFFACKKNASKETSVNKEFTVDIAQNYYKTLVTKFGDYDTIKISGKVEKNFKKVDFSKAYIGESETSYFVEVPIFYSKRKIIFQGVSGLPKSTVEKMTTNSFDRLVIYKNKTSGVVSEKIETFIPSIDYLNRNLNNLQNNHFQKIDSDFSGYVTNKNWKGEFQTTQSYISGNVVNNSLSALNRLKTASDNDEQCITVTFYFTYQKCDYEPDGFTTTNCEYFTEISQFSFCPIHTPTFPTHTNPGIGDIDWNGWPDPQNTPAGCPGTPRLAESPIQWATASGSTLSLNMYDACYCLGYSWIILEDISTGVEYSMPIINQNFAYGDTSCHVAWETNVEIPSSVPNGRYYVKVNLDSDVFYHQQQDVYDGHLIKKYYLDVQH